MKTKKGDFIELDFVASFVGGAVFDTTNEEEAKKAGLVREDKEDKEDKDSEDKNAKDRQNKQEFKPAKICVGEEMIVKGLDKAIEDKETGKEYEINLKPTDAFGKRDAKLIRTVSLGSFEQPPQPGIFVNMNGIMAKVISVSGGRTLIDLNNPLAGKEIHYKFKINKIIKDPSEKIKVLAERFPFEIDKVEVKDNKALIKLKNRDKIKGKVLEDFKKKAKTLVGLECDV